MFEDMAAQPGMFAEGTSDYEELAAQPNAEKPLHYLRTDELRTGGPRTGETLMGEPPISERDRLLNRASIVKCIAVLIAFLGAAYAFGIFVTLTGRDHVPPVAAFLLCSLMVIPIMIQYYLISSITVSLQAVVKLMDRLDERENETKK